jgi:hypothetical protein
VHADGSTAISLLQDGLCVASTRPGTFNFEPTVIRMLSPRYMAVAGRSSEFEIFDVLNKRVSDTSRPGLKQEGCMPRRCAYGLDCGSSLRCGQWHARYLH